MPAPTAASIQAAYFATSGYSTDEITSAFNAEKSAQAKKCNVPLDADPWPADLVDALARRVQHNLALRALPLGIQANMSDYSVQTTRVGGEDAEIRRLEAPYRKRVVG